MDNRSCVLAWLFFASTCTSQYFDSKALASALAEYFSIRHVIFLQPVKDMDDYVRAQKSFSQHLLYTSVLSYKDLTEIARRGTVYNVNSLVIIHSNDSDFDRSSLIKISNDVDISLFKWVLVMSKYDPKEYERLKIPFNCQFVIAEHSDSDEYVLTEIYDTLTVSKLSNHLGKWSAENGLEVNGVEFFTRRRNLRNTTFNISSNHKDPCSVHSFAEMAGSVLKCMHYRTFPVLAEMHNFRTRESVYQKLEVGHFDFHELWVMTFQDRLNCREKLAISGSIYMNLITINWMVMNRTGGFGPEVLSPEIQFSLFEISTAIDDSITVIWPTLRVPLNIYTGYTGQGFGWSTFIYPFSVEMWMAIVVWFVLSASAISVAELVLRNTKKTKRGQTYLRLWLRYVFSSFSAFCGQSEGRDPDKISLRILLYLIFLIPTALVPAYSAALTSYLAVKVEKMPFTNLEGLSKAKDYKLGFQATFNISVFFDKDSEDEVIRALMRDIVVPQNELPDTESEGIKKMCEGKYSFLGFDLSILAAPPVCSYFKLDRPVILAFIFLPVRLNLPYKHLIDRSLRTLLYKGVVAKETTRILPVTMNSDYPQEQYQVEELSPIMFENVITIFVGLGFGLFISVLIFWAERIHFKRTKMKSNRLTLKY